MFVTSLSCYFHPERAEYMANLDLIRRKYRADRDRLFQLAQPAVLDRNPYIMPTVKLALDNLRFDFEWNKMVLEITYMAQVKEERKRRRAAAKQRKVGAGVKRWYRSSEFNLNGYWNNTRRWHYEGVMTDMLEEHYEEFGDYYNDGCSRV